MTENSIRNLEIGNFKSIDSLRIQDLSPFSVFAGSNGSGKSNFFDALDFVSVFIRHGIEAALQKHGASRISVPESVRQQRLVSSVLTSDVSLSTNKNGCRCSITLCEFTASIKNRYQRSF